MMREEVLKEDDRPQKGGWAPGDYWHAHCRCCDRAFAGDKRAYECADCAYGPIYWRMTEEGPVVDDVRTINGMLETLDVEHRVVSGESVSVAVAKAFLKLHSRIEKLENSDASQAGTGQ